MASASKANVALLGLGVMGASLARNIESRGFPIVVYNRDTKVTKQFMSEFGSGNFIEAVSLEDVVAKLEVPRQIILMVTAGAAIDNITEALLPLLSKGDMVIDCGNSHYRDTQRRERRCKEMGIYFIGIGVSGGQEGALKGPSIMPGGDKKAWQILAPMLEKIAAYADGPCTAYVGPDGAGHFVKTVHNGIEYGDMQLIAEAYHLLRSTLNLSPQELSNIFAEWNNGVLSSFLIEITAKVLAKKDEDGKSYMVDVILDKAGQKGTGKWTAEEALDLGVPIPTLAAAVDARNLSALKDERVSASTQFAAPGDSQLSCSKEQFIAQVHGALYCSKIMAYAQGMALLAAASKQNNWDLRLGEISALWKGGCIIRAKFLDEIRKAYERKADLPNLILDPALKKELESNIPHLRKVLAVAAERGIPAPAFSASLNYFDSYRTADLPQSLTQGQRDFFGAHTYERKDRPGVFHTNW